MVKEILSLHVGQAGIKVGESCWDLYCAEHDISENGMCKVQGEKPMGFHTFFHETETSRYVPRSVFVDTDSETIAHIRSGKNKFLFNADQLIAGKQDASSCFGRGKFTEGKKVMEPCMTAMRQNIEKCDNLQGIVMFSAVGGGTGGGLGTVLISKIHDQWGDKKAKVAYTIFPSEKASAACVEPYNSVFSTNALVEYCDSVTMLDNEAIYGLCRQKLKIKDLQYLHLNRIIAQIISGQTLAMRFDGTLNVTLDQFHTNMVPFPRLHFMLSSLAPMAQPGYTPFQGLSAKSLTVDAFNPSSMMVKCDPSLGHYMAACVMYRGDIIPPDVAKAVKHIKERRKFVKWCPTGFKIGINGKQMMKLKGDEMCDAPRSAVMIGNNTSITDVFTRINKKYDMMYNRRAFIHWFIQEGMEEGEFPDAREMIDQVREDYQAVVDMETAIQSKAASQAGEAAPAEKEDEVSDV